jgi:hypothetical protein
MVCHQFSFVFSGVGLGPVVLSPLSKPIKTLLKQHQGEDIPQQYYHLSKKLFFMKELKM